jgi:hypothetical protein
VEEYRHINKLLLILPTMLNKDGPDLDLYKCSVTFVKKFIFPLVLCVSTICGKVKIDVIGTICPLKVVMSCFWVVQDTISLTCVVLVFNTSFLSSYKLGKFVWEKVKLTC